MILRILLLLLIAILVAGTSALAQQERVFVAADASMPMYQIGSIQIDTSRKTQATPQVVVQWRMVRPGVGSPTVRAITGEKNLILILAGVTGKRSGTLRFDYEGSTRQPATAAVWFEINRTREPSRLISNVQTLGRVDAERLPQMAGAKELEDFVEKDRRLPPKVLPQGYIPLLRNHPMAPGMRGKAARENQWIDGEVLAIDSKGWLTVKLDDPKQPLRLLPTLPSGSTGFFIVRPETLLSVQKNPRKFRPSLNILPGTIAEIPDDYVPLNFQPLPPGLPVKFAFSNGWEEGVFVSGDSNQVNLQTRFGSKTRIRKVDRSSLIVSKTDAKVMRRRDAARRYKENLEAELAVE